MKIQLQKIKIKDLVAGYVDSGENGVVGYSGKLNIRPAYQREFVYDDKKRNAVINSIIKGYPLNVMYWVKNGVDEYEVLDGQQRTISICEFAINNFSIEIDGTIVYINTNPDIDNKFFEYELDVYFCEGTYTEKLDWFETINIAGEQLTDQEIFNAIFVGPWVTDAKRYFSRRNCSAYNLGKDYLKGDSIRQDYLETAIKWISNNKVKQYMADHQMDKDASELWVHFQNVINWTKTTFPNYYKEMKGVDWGYLYKVALDKQSQGIFFNPTILAKRISDLMGDEDVTKKSGIFPYLITNEEKYLSIRAFTDNMKRETFQKQNGECIHCKGLFEIDEMEADHITPWSLGGPTTKENCQMLCVNCNRTKSSK